MYTRKIRMTRSVDFNSSVHTNELKLRYINEIMMQLVMHSFFNAHKRLLLWKNIVKQKKINNKIKSYITLFILIYCITIYIGEDHNRRVSVYPFYVRILEFQGMIWECVKSSLNLVHLPVNVFFQTVRIIVTNIAFNEIQAD